MRNDKGLVINIENPKAAFKQHIELPENERIIFSGIFGIGKTYFLDHFFDLEKYSVIHLFPVNYSIANNQDIFKFIKYDILYDIIVHDKYKMEVEGFMEKYDKYDLIGFGKLNFAFLIAYIVHFIPETGRAASNFIEKIIGHWNEYKSGLIKKEEEENEFIQVQKFVQKTENHFIIENDIITQIIKNALSEIKISGKENVLIIDDLDRIDPEHIFRLLNIFAASIDSKDSEYQNKFGFDKVIFVLDIQNLRNIFHNRYGSDTDFSGYIDKFYSHEIFNFENTNAISGHINEIVSSIKIDGNDKGILNFEGKNLSNYEVRILLECMVKSEAVNLRALTKLKDKLYIIPIYKLYLPNRMEATNIEYSPFILYDFMISLFGNSIGLLKALDKCMKKTSFNPQMFNTDGYTANLINLLEVIKFELIINSKNSIITKKYFDIIIEYDPKSDYGNKNFRGNIVSAKNIEGVKVDLDYNFYLKLLKLTFEEIMFLHKNPLK